MKIGYKESMELFGPIYVLLDSYSFKNAKIRHEYLKHIHLIKSKFDLMSIEIRNSHQNKRDTKI